jgi:hypothetical protein
LLKQLIVDRITMHGLLSIRGTRHGRTAAQCRHAGRTTKGPSQRDSEPLAARAACRRASRRPLVDDSRAKRRNRPWQLPVGTKSPAGSSKSTRFDGAPGSDRSSADQNRDSSSP